MHPDSNKLRPRGTGSLLSRSDRSGATTWYGKWRVGDRQVMRRLGPSRKNGSKTGLTRTQAEAELRRAIEASSVPGPQATEGLGVAEAGARYLASREAVGLKRGTLQDYESYLRVHLVPFFAGRTLEQIEIELVEAFVAAKRREGKAVKSILNYLGLLHAIYAHAIKRGWSVRNPVSLADKPRVARNTDIRFLSLEELEAIVAATPSTPLGRTDRLLYLTAAMTGLRRGEAVALRWQDVDWSANLIRIRRSFTRGEFGMPKSRRSSRAVPLAPRLRAELEEHYRNTPHASDQDLVFAHPANGNVLDPSKLRKRFQACARRAGVRPVRLHDLRHTYGTRMAAAGAPLRAIQEWLGHSDLRTTLIYADYALDPHQGALYAERAFARPGSR
jgi:integrase